MYEHITITHPSSLPMASFGSHLECEIGIIQWHDDFYVHPSDKVRHDMAYYHHMLTQLVPDQVSFRPYHSYLIWVELVGELIGIR